MPSKSQPRHTLSYQLREIIDSRGLTAYAAAKLAEVDPGVVSRWMSGQRDIRMETADKLALALGLRLTETPGGRARAARVRPVRPTRPLSRPSFHAPVAVEEEAAIESGGELEAEPAPGSGVKVEDDDGGGPDGAHGLARSRNHPPGFAETLLTSGG